MSAALPAVLEYPFAAPPAPGEAIEIAPRILWLRMPLPFALDHINLWLLADDDGTTLVDCGFGDVATRALWERHLATTLVAADPAHHRDALPSRSRRQCRVAVGTLRSAGRDDRTPST